MISLAKISTIHKVSLSDAERDAVLKLANDPGLIHFQKDRHGRNLAVFMLAIADASSGVAIDVMKATKRGADTNSITNEKDDFLYDASNVLIEWNRRVRFIKWGPWYEASLMPVIEFMQRWDLDKRYQLAIQ